MNFVGLYFHVELFSWTHSAREAKSTSSSTSSYVAIQNLLEYPPKWAFYCCHWDTMYHGHIWGGGGGHWELSQTEQCSKLLDRVRKLAVCVEIY